ncbi:MAG: ferritin family protein [Rhodocyclaceae bacterium]|nr:ferritin family protein [Rhodocyclaceae bacterium]
MTDSRNIGSAVLTMPALLAHALAMESEACERYGQLADQMENCNNAPVARLFRRLEDIERAHVREIEAICRDFTLPRLAPWEYAWRDNESPETIDIGSVSYQMSPRDAVALAIEHERRAADFYEGVADASPDAEVKRVARQFASEELEHVQWLREWLAEKGSSAERGVDDPDPPNSLE